MLFPQRFFYTAALLAAGIALALALVMGGLSGTYLLLGRKQQTLQS